MTLYCCSHPPTHTRRFPVSSRSPGVCLRCVAPWHSGVVSVFNCAPEGSGDGLRKSLKWGSCSLRCHFHWIFICLLFHHIMYKVYFDSLNTLGINQNYRCVERVLLLLPTSQSGWGVRRGSCARSCHTFVDPQSWSQTVSADGLFLGLRSRLTLSLRLSLIFVKVTLVWMVRLRFLLDLLQFSQISEGRKRR